MLVSLSLNVLTLSLAYASNHSQPEIEIVRKITIHGPKGGGGPPTPLATTGVLGASAPPVDRRWAVVIGISDYYGTSADLQYGDDDALDIVKALTEIYGYKRENIRLLMSDHSVNNATRDEILGAISWVDAREAVGDEIVFFYSGHGARGTNNPDGDREAVDEGIVPYELTTDSIIWDGNLAAFFKPFKAGRIVFIFDTCYAGGMTDLKAKGGIIAMSSGENQVSYESDALANGVFAYWFVDAGMLRGKADTIDHDKDGIYAESSDVTIEEAFDYARANAPTSAPQTPTISDSFANDLLL